MNILGANWSHLQMSCVGGVALYYLRSYGLSPFAPVLPQKQSNPFCYIQSGSMTNHAPDQIDWTNEHLSYVLETWRLSTERSYSTVEVYRAIFSNSNSIKKHINPSFIPSLTAFEKENNSEAFKKVSEILCSAPFIKLQPPPEGFSRHIATSHKTLSNTNVMLEGDEKLCLELDQSIQQFNCFLSVYYSMVVGVDKFFLKTMEAGKKMWSKWGQLCFRLPQLLSEKDETKWMLGCIILSTKEDTVVERINNKLPIFLNLFEVAVAIKVNKAAIEKAVDGSLNDGQVCNVQILELKPLFCRTCRMSSTIGPEFLAARHVLNSVHTIPLYILNINIGFISSVTLKTQICHSLKKKKIPILSQYGDEIAYSKYHISSSSETFFGLENHLFQTPSYSINETNFIVLKRGDAYRSSLYAKVVESFFENQKISFHSLTKLSIDSSFHSPYKLDRSSAISKSNQKKLLYDSVTKKYNIEKAENFILSLHPENPVTQPYQPMCVIVSTLTPALEIKNFGLRLKLIDDRYLDFNTKNLKIDVDKFNHFIQLKGKNSQTPNKDNLIQEHQFRSIYITVSKYQISLSVGELLKYQKTTKMDGMALGAGFEDQMDLDSQEDGWQTIRKRRLKTKLDALNARPIIIIPPKSNSFSILDEVNLPDTTKPLPSSTTAISSTSSSFLSLSSSSSSSLSSFSSLSSSSSSSSFTSSSSLSSSSSSYSSSSSSSSSLSSSSLSSSSSSSSIYTLAKLIKASKTASVTKTTRQEIKPTPLTFKRAVEDEAGIMSKRLEMTKIFSDLAALIQCSFISLTESKY